MDRFEQLDESGLAVFRRQVALTVTSYDLPQQCDFLDATRNQFSALSYDIRKGSAALLAAGVGDDAESAILIASLHNADECGDRVVCVAVEEVLANRAFAFFFFGNVHHFLAPASEEVIQVFGSAMKLLCPHHEVNVRQAVNQL